MMDIGQCIRIQIRNDILQKGRFPSHASYLVETTSVSQIGSYVDRATELSDYWNVIFDQFECQIIMICYIIPKYS